MPSEKLVDDVLGILKAPRESYRSAVVSSVEELRALLTTHRASEDDYGGTLADELGPFARGRVDAGGLATLISVKETVAPDSLEVMERAAGVLADRAVGSDEVHLVAVPPGGDLRDVVRDALADAGIVYGVARAAELARTGAYDPEKHNALFSAYPFRRWSSTERLVAPPLVVEVEGADLRPAGLVDFLDGAVAIVLLVRGAAPPASLARAIAPGVTVIQSRTLEGLRPIEDAEGPILAALFEDAEDAVPFVHDPGAGEVPAKRIEVDADLDELRAALDEERWKDRTWAQDLAHLLDLASSSGTGAESRVESGEEAEVGEVDRLAAWLLAQTDLSDDAET